MRFPGAEGGVISPEGSLRIPVESVNYDKLRVIVWQLYDNNIPLAARGGFGYGGYPTDLSRLVVSKEFAVKGRPNETARRALDLRPLIGDERGVFYVVAQGIGRSWSETRAAINVTDIGLTLTMGRSAAVARVTVRILGKTGRGSEGDALVLFQPTPRRRPDRSRRTCRDKA